MYFPFLLYLRRVTIHLRGNKGLTRLTISHRVHKQLLAVFTTLPFFLPVLRLMQRALYQNPFQHAFFSLSLYRNRLIII